MKDGESESEVTPFFDVPKIEHRRFPCNKKPGIRTEGPVHQHQAGPKGQKVRTKRNQKHQVGTRNSKSKLEIETRNRNSKLWILDSTFEFEFWFGPVLTLCTGSSVHLGPSGQLCPVFLALRASLVLCTGPSVLIPGFLIHGIAENWRCSIFGTSKNGVTTHLTSDSDSPSGRVLNLP